MNFYSRNNLILISSLALVVIAWLCFPNYYSEYEAICSKLYQLNFGSAVNPQRINTLSPMLFTFYESLWGILYNFKEDIFWYDFTMLALTLIAVINFFHGFSLQYKNSQISPFLKHLIYFSLLFLIFYWLIRVQHFTHTAYILCFTALYNYLHIVSNNEKHSKLILPLTGFILGMFLRWDVGVITIFIFSVYIFMNGDFSRWKRFIPLYVLFSINLLYVWFFMFTDKSFYWQIEPDGEYVVLYQGALKLPENATHLDTLKYDMLNSWIVDDSSLISIEYFKNAIAHAKQNRTFELNTKLLSGYYMLKELVVSRWYVVLLIVFFSLIAMAIKGFKIIGFLAIAFLFIFFIAFKSVLSERHFLSMIIGILLFLIPAINKSSRLSILIFISIVSVAILKTIDIHARVFHYKKIAIAQAEEIHLFESYLDKGILLSDTQYENFFPRKTFNTSILLKEVIFISLQQLSYADFFKNYIESKCKNGHLNYVNIFNCYANGNSPAYILSSPNRIKIFERILAYYKSPVIFIKEKNTKGGNTDFAVSNTIDVYKITTNK
jgi:hypothetical protein